MRYLVGIIHPSAFQVTELTDTVSRSLGGDNRWNSYKFKNLEVGFSSSSTGCNKKRTVWAFFDGTLYNRNELIRTLQISDSLSEGEIVAHAYERWKEKTFSHLDGPFALAIFDEDAEKLFLARDRLGQKTLYWYSKGQYWVFGTQIKALIATGVVAQTPALDAIGAYLYLGFIPQDMAPIKDVNKLLPGHYLTVDLSRAVNIHQYWSLSRYFEEKKESISKEEAYHKLQMLLERPINRENLTVAVTGTLGSSATALLAKDKHPLALSPLLEPTDNDLSSINNFAKSLSLSHKSEKISADIISKNIVPIVWHLDEPNADPSVFQTWELGKMGKNSELLTDLGWEELFAGSKRYFTENHGILTRPFAYQLASLPKTLRDLIIMPLLRLFGSKTRYRVLRSVDIEQEQMDALIKIALFRGHSYKSLSPKIYDYFDPIMFTQRFHKLTQIGGEINPSLYFDAKTELPDSKLLQYERLLTPHNASAHSLFLDHSLFEFMAKIPEAIKFERRIPGHMLRKVLSNYTQRAFPAKERDEHYLNLWRKNEEIRKYFRQLMTGRLVEEGYISAKWIKKQLEYPYLTILGFKRLWGLLVLEIWFRYYIAKPIGTRNHEITLEELFEL